MNGWNQDEVLAEVARLIRDIIGEDWVEELPIALDTSFSQDLELESIEFVALAEQLKARYPEVDFTSWLGAMELGEILELRVGRLVAHIVDGQACASRSATA